MLNDRVVIRSNETNHILFLVFKTKYPPDIYGPQAPSEHYHSELEISAILTGGGVYTCCGIEYHFSAGDVFVHRSNDSHVISCIDAGEPLTMVVIQFEPRLIWNSGNEWISSKYLQIFMRDSSVSSMIPGSDENAVEIRRLLDECFRECKEERPAYDLIVKAKILSILAHLVRYYETYITTDTQVDSVHLKHVECAMNYIMSHIEQPFTLVDLAREAQMSRSYFSTVFRTLNGISVWDYVTKRRIERAQYLLESTGDSITEISAKSGFNNVANFNRAFKKVTGDTPREYRKAWLNSSRRDGM